MSKPRSKLKNRISKTGEFVYNQFRQKSLKMLKFLVMARSPFTVSQLKAIRLEIMKSMKLKGFETHYFARMKSLNEKMKTMTQEDISNDDYWAKEFAVPFWVEESPELYKRYKSNLEKITTRETGIASLTNMILNDKNVRKMFNQDWMNAQFKILMKSLLSSYYLTQPGNIDRLWPIHLNIDLSYKTNTSTTNTPMEAVKQLIQACFAGSGPFVLKILQQITIMAGSEIEITEGEKLESLASAIFKNVPPLTKGEREFIYETFRNDSGLMGTIGKMLGSASIAEAHLYTETEIDPETGKKQEMEYVMKFIKPIYAYYFLCETDFLLNVTWREIRKWSNGNENHIRQTRQTLMYFIKEFSSEFSYGDEYRYTQHGKIYETFNPERPITDKNNDRISSVIIYYPKLEEIAKRTLETGKEEWTIVKDPFPVFVMNKLDGYSGDKLIEELEKSKLEERKCYSQDIREVYDSFFELYQRWIKNAIFGNGFFHADMHPGNFMIEKKLDKMCEFVRPYNKINILDYGSSGQLTKRQQCKLLKAMVIPQQLKEIELYPNTTPKKLSYVLTANSKKHNHNINIAEKFIRSVNEICEITKMKPKEVKRLAPYLLDYQKDQYGLANSFNHLFTKYMEYAVEIGTCSSNALILFGRGLTYLDNLMYRLASICDDEFTCPEFPGGKAITPLVIKNLVHSVKCAGAGNLISAATNRG
jgi:hypothetical protein